MKVKNIITKILVLSIVSCSLSAQDIIQLVNPSFEGTPRQGTFSSGMPFGWYDCGGINFKNETAPDIHPKGFWENTLPASHGNTYLGMVVRDNESWESVSQKMSSTLKAGSCYKISLEIAQSANYWSGIRSKPESTKNFNYSEPTVLRIWGGTNYCNTRELLAESSTVTNAEWKTYHFKLKPKSDYRYLVFEAFYKTPTLDLYNGHILIDNISDIIEMDCAIKIEPITDFVYLDDLPQKDILTTPKLHKKKKQPAHKRNRKIKKEHKDLNSYNNSKISKSSEYGTFSNIDLQKLKKGQILKLEKVYFEADTTTLNTSSYIVLDELHQFLRSNSNIVIEIGGHTNSTPTKSYCKKLSTLRAKKVANYLIEKGISKTRISYKGYGKSKPIASNKTKVGRKKNQRVEIKILEIG